MKHYITYYRDLIQGSDEWLAARCGLLTASEMKLIITPTFKIVNNEKERLHLFELLAQRITKFVEPQYVSDSMLRGQEDEVEAKIRYAEKYAPVKDVGFITNNRWGFTLGYSPDGLVGNDGLIECKSRSQKYQTQTLLNRAMPDDFLMQVQTGLLVSEREWCDFVSYCAGMPMITVRVYPDKKVQEAIIEAATNFEARLQIKLTEYADMLLSYERLIPTERKVYEDILV